MEWKDMPNLSIDNYLDEVYSSIIGQEKEIQSIVDIIKRTKYRGSRLWILGNGGSLAIAQHLAQDLLKMHDVKSQCLNDPSVISAYANDDGFENCFFNPLSKLIDTGDIVMAFSCSGKSKNYENIFSKMDNEKIAIVGTDGGFMKIKSDFCVHVESISYKVCEAAFGIIADLINIGLEE